MSPSDLPSSSAASPPGGSPTVTPDSGVPSGGLQGITTKEELVQSAPAEERPTWFTRFRRAYVKASGGSLLLSIGIHAVILILGAWLVVSQVTEERKISFGGGEAGPKSEVQHKVKRKATTAPAPNKRITTTSSIAKVALPEMPSIQMNMGPSIAGAMGAGGLGSVSGLGGGGKGGAGGGGFSKITFFGLRGGAGPGLQGRLYDLKQLANGQPSEMYPKTALERMESGLGLEEMIPRAKGVLQAFIKSWDTSVLAKYYRAPDSLVATQIFIPNAPASELPKAFGLEGKVKPGLLVMHYKTTVKAPRTGTFRFVGLGDDFLVVSINGKNVLDGSWPLEGDRCILDKESAVKTNVGNAFASVPLVGGKWFDLSAGQSYEIQIILGDEGFGGHISSFLLIQEKGKTYPSRPDDPKAQLLPIFKVDANSPLPPYEKGKTGPPVAPELVIFPISPAR
jgi:hypothetical protein